MVIPQMANVVHATGVKTAHLVARTFFLSFDVSGTRTPEHFSSRMYAWLKFAPVTLHLRGLEWFAPLRIQNTSSFVMSHPNLGLAPESVTSFFCTPSQPLQTTCSTKPERTSLTELRYRNFTGRTVWLSDHSHHCHRSEQFTESLEDTEVFAPAHISDD